MLPAFLATTFWGVLRGEAAHYWECFALCDYCPRPTGYGKGDRRGQMEPACRRCSPLPDPSSLWAAMVSVEPETNALIVEGYIP